MRRGRTRHYDVDEAPAVGEAGGGDALAAAYTPAVGDAPAVGVHRRSVIDPSWVAADRVGTMYTMDVPVSTFRSQLKHWIDRAGEGEDLIITERGVPVARLTAVAGSDLIASLERDGLLSAPDAERPPAPAAEGRAHSVSDLVRRLRR